MSKVSPLLYIISFSIFVFGCRKSAVFDEQPYAEYRSHKFTQDANLGLELLALTIYFTDGDGDVGLNDADTLAPFDRNTRFFNNFWVELYSIKNGESKDTFIFDGRIPNLTPAGQNKTLEGEIEYRLTSGGFNPGDSIMIGFQLVDRSLKVSEKAFTPYIIIE